MEVKTKQVLKDRKYLLKGTSTPLSFAIASRDTVRKRLLFYDEEKETQRALRYARNQRSPFLDEQDDNAIVEPVVFVDGVLDVSRQNVILQHFLLLHPGNEKNGGNEFYEFDPEENAKQNIINLEQEVDALIMARTLPLNKMKSIARIYLKGNVDTMTVSEIKHDILVYAKTNPADFLDAAEDPDLELATVATRAIAEQYVLIKNGKDIYYNLKENKKKLMTVAYGENASDAFSAWLYSDHGNAFLSFLTKEFEEK
jgi:hypothetical protein